MAKTFECNNPKFYPFLLLKLKELAIYFQNKGFCLIPIVIIAIYNLIFFNRFYPITEGWFSTYAYLFNHGQMPYKDFYFYLPPLYLVKIGLFTKIFGYNIINLRLLGIVIILLFAFFLYKNMESLFGSLIATFVSIVGVIYYQSNNAHITYDFIQFVTLYSLIQIYFIFKYLNYHLIDNKKSLKYIFLAGFFAGLTLLTKHSNGTMIILFSFIGVIAVNFSNGLKHTLKAVCFYISGIFIPVIIMLIWLGYHSALNDFYEQVVIGTIKAKGGSSQILFSWFQGVLTENFVSRFKEIIIFFIVFGYWLFYKYKKSVKYQSISKIFYLISIAMLLIFIFCPLFLKSDIIQELSHLGKKGINTIIVTAIVTPLSVLLISFIRMYFKKSIDTNLMFFSFIALGFIYGTGTSAGITEVGAFAGFCLFLGLALHLKSVFGLGKVFIVLFSLSFLIMFIEVKYSRPYYWWNATSPDIRTKLEKAENMSLLKGIYTSKENLKLIEEVTSELTQSAKINDPVLTFPNIPVFYLFSNRWPPGKALVHWFDFLTDDLAIKEAEVIRIHPPNVIVYLDLGSTVWEAHERLFRGGKPSGQREIDKAIKEIIISNKMSMVKQFELPNNVFLRIWKQLRK
ncbi:MAG: glycosyltransferase family 39 protein [Candidatus Firestonebacteria bacterium]